MLKKNVKKSYEFSEIFSNFAVFKKQVAIFAKILKII